MNTHEAIVLHHRAEVDQAVVELQIAEANAGGFLTLREMVVETLRSVGYPEKAAAHKALQRKT